MGRLTSLGVVLVAVLMASIAYGVPGDSWSLQGDFAKHASGNPATINRPTGGSASWGYYHERTILMGPVTDNFQSELPTNTGWTTTGGWAHTSMNKMSQSSADAGKNTNWLAGEVGGHSSTSYGVGTKWTTNTGGTFRVDVTGFHARKVNPNFDQELRLTSPSGLETWAISRLDNNGSANAVAATREFTLNSGDALWLEMKGPTWFGMTMDVTEIPEPSSLLLLGFAALGMCGRGLRRG